MSDRLNEVTPNFITVKCPVCNSFGSLKYGTVKCHGCSGRGYIVIDNRTGLPVDVIDTKNDKNND